MFSGEFQEWGEPHISRKEHSEIREQLLSPNVQSPTLQPPPSDSSSECNEFALPSRLTKYPGLPRLTLRQAHGSGDARPRATGQPGGGRAVLQRPNVSESEVGSGVTSRQRGEWLGLLAEVLSSLPPMRSITPSPHVGLVVPSPSVQPIATQPSEGRVSVPSSVGYIVSPTSTTSNQSEVLSWTSQDSRQSLLFSPWGVRYRIQVCVIGTTYVMMDLIRLQTETNPRGHHITNVWRVIRMNKEDRVAKLEWAPDGGLGRAVIGKVRPFPSMEPFGVFLTPLFHLRPCFPWPTWSDGTQGSV